MIDWNKPIELEDGTPVAVDCFDGEYYWVKRLDGKQFFHANSSRKLCVSQLTGAGVGGLTVRNVEGDSNDAWKRYVADFNALSDEEVENRG